jgi:hypothetical protein
MKMIGDGHMPEDWSRQLNLLIDLAIRGDRIGVVRQLNTLVKGYTPHYEFHGIESPAEDMPASSVLASPSSKSIH